jgi:hypothetical protein
MRSAALAAVLLLLAGCDFDPHGRCASSAECPRGLVCAGGLCAAADAGTANAPPVAVADAYSVTKGQALECPAEIGLLANDWDPEGDELVAERVGAARTAEDGMAFVDATGAFVYQPRPGFTGTDAFTYRAGDGTAWSETATVTLTVTP